MNTENKNPNGSWMCDVVEHTLGHLNIRFADMKSDKETSIEVSMEDDEGNKVTLEISPEDANIFAKYLAESAQSALRIERIYKAE